MFSSLADAVKGSASAYPIVFGVVATDAVLPILPGETAIIAGGILAAGGHLSVVLVFLFAAAGAFAGDNVTYWAGRRFGPRAARLLFRGEKSQRTLEWAERQLDRRGPLLVAAARFVPGGRTATTFTAGTLDMAYVRFAGADLVGASLWAAYATALGYFGGHTFENSLWKPLLVALGMATVVGLVGEAWRRAHED